jgi:hypothetical protein
MIIDVTRADIDATPRPRGPLDWCPIERAIRRALRWPETDGPATDRATRDDPDLCVGGLFAEFFANAYLVVELPDAARAFVVDFDEGIAVEPFAFELPIDHLVEGDRP